MNNDYNNNEIPTKEQETVVPEKKDDSVLYFGIAGILLSFCTIVPGIIVCIIALVKAKKLTRLEGELSSNNKIGKILAIIGLCIGIGALAALIVSLVITFFSAIASFFLSLITIIVPVLGTWIMYGNY